MGCECKSVVCESVSVYVPVPHLCTHMFTLLQQLCCCSSQQMLLGMQLFVITATSSPAQLASLEEEVLKNVEEAVRIKVSHGSCRCPPFERLVLSLK